MSTLPQYQVFNQGAFCASFHLSQVWTVSEANMEKHYSTKATERQILQERLTDRKRNEWIENIKKDKKSERVQDTKLKLNLEFQNIRNLNNGLMNT